MKKRKTYHIKKTIIEKGITVYLNDSLGTVLEINDADEAMKLCQILNSNSDNNCKYEIEGYG